MTLDDLCVDGWIEQKSIILEDDEFEYKDVAEIVNRLKPYIKYSKTSCDINVKLVSTVMKQGELRMIDRGDYDDYVMEYTKEFVTWLAGKCTDKDLGILETFNELVYNEPICDDFCRLLTVIAYKAECYRLLRGYTEGMLECLTELFANAFNYIWYACDFVDIVDGRSKFYERRGYYVDCRLKEFSGNLLHIVGGLDTGEFNCARDKQEVYDEGESYIGNIIKLIKKGLKPSGFKEGSMNLPEF